MIYNSTYFRDGSNYYFDLQYGCKNLEKQKKALRK